eukprot:2283147-Amphidinium_carterae.1
MNRNPCNRARFSQFDNLALSRGTHNVAEHYVMTAGLLRMSANPSAENTTTLLYSTRRKSYILYSQNKP